MKDLVKIIYNPEEVFKKGGNFLLPLLAAIILSLVFFFILTPLKFDQIVQNITQRISELPEDQKQKILENLTLTKFMIRGAIAILLTIPLKVLLQALIYQVMMPLTGGEINYKSSLFILSWANFISTLSGFIKVPLALVTGNLVIHTDLSILLNTQEGFLYKLLTQVDIFTLWSLWVLGLGLSIMGKVERKKAYILVFALWIVYIIAVSLIPFRGGFAK